MKQLFSIILLSLAVNYSHATDVVSREVEYKNQEGISFKGYVAYPEGKEQIPVVLVVHEWWGCNEYVRMRANMLAEQGYFAFAVDMYGEGELAENPEQATKLSSVFYANPSLAVERLEAAIDFLANYKIADANNISGIGYCFGGSMVLNAMMSGMNLRTVTSFHGGLNGITTPSKGVKGKILVCHGNSDSFVSAEDVQNFKNDLDSKKISYQFIGYENATHAFTNPKATENGDRFNLPIAYNMEADAKSWEDLRKFLEENTSKR